MEIVLHFMYVVAIKDSWATFSTGGHGGKMIKKMAWEGDTPFELAMISFWNLVVMWLKVSHPEPIGTIKYYRTKVFRG